MARPIIAKTWTDVVRIASDYPFHIFRGQGDSGWVLEPSLHRAIRARSYHDDCDIIEYALLRAFKRGIRRYISELPLEDDYVGWLSLMQHYGTPTRLLDFTQSYYVAAYFALISAQRDSALWIADLDFLLRSAGLSRPEGRHGIKSDWQPLANDAANTFLSTRLSDALSAAGENSELGVVPVEPFQQHDRLSTQQGLFLMPLDALGTIESNLRPVINRRHAPMKKVILREQLREDGLKHLREMNITAETLFPGIDGFARSLLHTQLG